VAATRGAAPGLTQSKLQVGVASSWKQGEPVTVTAQYPYSVDILGVVVKSGNLKSEITERVE
jgi:hypothetical protein